jgi:hypothetical protein
MPTGHRQPSEQYDCQKLRVNELVATPLAMTFPKANLDRYLLTTNVDYTDWHRRDFTSKATPLLGGPAL